MKKLIFAAIAITLLSGCRQPPSRGAEEPVVPAEHPRPVPTARQPTLDPKSSSAAEQLVRQFARLIEQGDLNEAYMLLGPSAPPRSSFDANFSHVRGLRVSVGPPGKQDGAAGSIYVSVPLTVSGTANQKRVSRSGKAILRRVNDVPGSTEAQRHWHIERIDWGSAT